MPLFIKIGIAENKALLDLQKELADSLISREFRLENRRFSPHITMAREVRLTTNPNQAALLGEPFATQVSAISLMRSERIGGMLTYTEQYRRER